MSAEWSEGLDDPVSSVVLWARFGNCQTIPMSVSNSG
jgi:hypothetical protein